MILLSLVYILLQVILFTAIKKFFSSNGGSSNEIKISIITAARNESSSIKDCIEAIKKIEYPDSNFEFIISDDDSSDDTYKVAEQEIKGHFNFKLTGNDKSMIAGKRDALLRGIKQSSFPFILITDADCIPSPGWLRKCSALFEQGYDFIFGPAPFYMENNLVNQISCMENLKNQFLSFSLATLGFPYTASARNMGFSLKAFTRIGGYSRTRQTIGGDDDLLLREAVRNGLKIKAFYDRNAFVYSSSKKTLKEYLKQKARHTSTSVHYMFRHKFILAIWHLLNLFITSSIFLVFLNINFIWLFIIKLVSDFIILISIQQRFGYKFKMLQLILLDLLYELFIVINFYNAVFRKNEWK